MTVVTLLLLSGCVMFHCCVCGVLCGDRDLLGEVGW
jgi:hypothetical protein